ncbi:unnamed protein product [Fusarium graminearum]|uniref:Uncharacterized protein n=1 Tax=Gibberella zeae TaxID=5518 RepID=A0A9N8RCB3_GIBZA|nr:unnamed protein product [Fusarium graminearum]CAG1982837.1 unnamed protein product [Fusarium graminearum]
MLASSVYISSLSPPSSPALPPAALPNQTSPQLNILTIVDHAVVIHSGGKWKENIAWQIPHSNHWLARINCQQANAELLSMVRPAEGNNIKRCYLSHDEGDGNVSVIICKIRITEQGRVQYLPEGVRPERVEQFIPWLAMFMGFDSLHRTSDDDVTAHDENSPASDSASSGSSHSDCRSSTSSGSDGEFPSDPDECRHLGHIEAIPYGHNRNVRIIRRARVAIEEDNWFVMNWNFYGPKVDICYRIPGPKNTWIARISSRVNEGELLRIVGHHSSQEQQRWDRVHYITSESHMGEDAVSFIVECVKRTATGRLFHKATGPEKIPALQQRMGFQVIEV